MSINHKMQNQVKRGHVVAMWPTFGILWRPNISGTVKLEISNFASRRTAMSANDKLQNQVKRGNVGAMWPTFGILWPPNISGTVKARKFKFGRDMEGGDC